MQVERSDPSQKEEQGLQDRQALSSLPKQLSFQECTCLRAPATSQVLWKLCCVRE